MSDIRWGIIGTGTIADLFVQALLVLPGAKVQAVAARSPDRAKEFAGRHGIPVALGSYEQLLQDKEVDVVYIATANEHHHGHCLAALSAGKAVLCEKPFALTAKEAAEIVKLARQKGLFCMEAMWMRFAPAVRESLSLARDGKLGELQFFSGQLGFPYVADQGNRLFRQPGGGALLDLGVYPLSLAQVLFGTPTQIMSTARLSSNGVDEQFASVLNYKEGTQAVIAASLKAKLSNMASIHGANSVLQLEEPLYFPESYKLTNTPTHSTERKTPGKLASVRRLPIIRTLAEMRNKRHIRAFNTRTSQSGYSFEATEVQRCLKAGLLESPEMPLADTLAVMESMDRIRSCWAITSRE